MFQTFFYIPILNLVIFLYNIIGDLGIAIIVLTIIIKLVLLPLSKKSLQSQKSLQDIQPKMDEIKRKYKDNKEEMGRAMMELYKKNKVNPFSSCLPLLIQMPFLIAVFNVFRDGFENGALEKIYPFITRPDFVNSVTLGLVDLNQKNILIAILAGVAQFFQGWMLTRNRPKPKLEGSQDEDFAAIMNKQMTFVMPIITVVFAMNFPGGLALYWLITTLLTIIQQKFLFNKDKLKTDVIEGEIVE